MPYSQSFPHKPACEEKTENMALALEYRGTFKFLLGDAEGALQDINKSIKLAPSVQAYIKRSSINMEESKVMESFEASKDSITLLSSMLMEDRLIYACTLGASLIDLLMSCNAPSASPSKNLKVPRYSKANAIFSVFSSQAGL